LEKANKLTNTSRSFSLLSELWMRYTPLTWYEREDLRYKAHLCPEHFVFTSPRVEGWITKILLSVLQVGIPVHKIHKSALLKVKGFT